MFYTCFTEVLEKHPLKAKFKIPEAHYAVLDVIAPHITAEFLLQWLQTDSVGEAENIVNDFVHEALPEDLQTRLDFLTGTEWKELLDHVVFVFLAVIKGNPAPTKG